MSKKLKTYERPAVEELLVEIGSIAVNSIATGNENFADDGVIEF